MYALARLILSIRIIVGRHINAERREKPLFILSLRKNQIILRLCIILAFAAAAFLIILSFTMFIQQKEKYRDFGGKKLCLEIKSTQDALNAAGFFGADINGAAVTCENIRIPLYFNDTYKHYDFLQRDFGSELERYKSRECIKYCIRPDGDDDNGVTYTLLVCDGRLIGGDISDNDFSGEMKGLFCKSSS